MRELPWATERRLDEVAEVRLGRQRSPKNHFGENMRPYLRAANVGWNGLNLDDVKHMNFTNEEMNIYRLQPGDVVLGEASGSPDEVGKPALWRGEIEECALQNTLLRVRPSPELDSRYLLGWLRSLATNGEFATASRGVGIHHIGRAKLAAWPIPLPPIEEQRRIVDVLEDHLSRLDAADAYLDAAMSRSIALVNSARARAFDNASVQGVELQFLQLLRTSAGGRAIHQGWSPACDSMPSRSEDEWGVLKTTSIQSGHFDATENKRLPAGLTARPSIEVAVGDLLLTRAGPRARCGVVCLVRETRAHLMLSDKMYRMRVDENIAIPEYVETLLLSPQAQRQLDSLKTGISDSGVNLTQSRLASLRVPVPSVEVQRAALIEVEGVHSIAANGAGNVEAVARRGASLRRALVDAAFSGRLMAHLSDLERAEEPIV